MIRTYAQMLIWSVLDVVTLEPPISSPSGWLDSFMNHIVTDTMLHVMPSTAQITPKCGINPLKVSKHFRFL